MKRYDLHTHSSYSDGVLSPKELVHLAHDQGVDVMALTDHDTVSGLPEALQAAQALGIELVNGVEISCSWNRQSIHIVGLGVDPGEHRLVEGLRSNVDVREQRAKQMIEKLDKLGVSVESEVRAEAGLSVPTRTHFARAMVRSGTVRDIKHAFRRYLTNGKPGYVAANWASVAEAISWIDGAGGIAVLAHPLAYRMTRTRLRRLLKEFSASGGRGLELVSGNTDNARSAMLAALAEEFGLLGSVGSDFHSPEQRWAMVGRCASLPSTASPVWA